MTFSSSYKILANESYNDPLKMKREKKKLLNKYTKRSPKIIQSINPPIKYDL
jgi:hypothetical protein